MSADTKNGTARSSTIELRLRGVLEARLLAEGGYAPLARKITEAYEAATGRKVKKDAAVVDRRKLRDIIEDTKVNLSLTLRDLEALDAYLEPYNEGLAHHPLLKKPDILQAMAASGQVTFLIGAKTNNEGPTANDGTEYFATFDVLAMSWLLRRLNTFLTGVTVDIQEVPTYPAYQPGPLDPAQQPWVRLFDETGPSLVCIGGSWMLPAAELMLCHMLGGEPYEKGSFTERRKLPFHFLCDKEDQLASRFVARHSEMDELGLGVSTGTLSAAGDAPILVTADGAFPDELSHRQFGDTYGLCVAQRRANGRIWLLLAGISGPATLAAALLVHKLQIQFSDSRPGKASDVYFAVVGGHVPEAAQRHRVREPGERIVVDARRWSFDEGD